MTPEEAGVILRYCSDAWPSMKIGEDTAVVWADGLAGIDAQDAMTAVRALAKAEEWPPNLARVVHAARGVAKGHEARKALPRTRGGGHQAAQAVAALRALSGQMRRPDHDHRHGRDGCPSCATAADRAKLFAHEAADLLADYGIEIDPDRAARFATEGQPG